MNASHAHQLRHALSVNPVTIMMFIRMIAITNVPIIACHARQRTTVIRVAMVTMDNNCQDQCSNGCSNDQCDKDTGRCNYCKAGFTGSGKCDQCEAGKYGTDCDTACKSSNCLQKSMSQNTLVSVSLARTSGTANLAL